MITRPRPKPQESRPSVIPTTVARTSQVISPTRQRMLSQLAKQQSARARRTPPAPVRRSIARTRETTIPSFVSKPTLVKTFPKDDPVAEKKKGIIGRAIQKIKDIPSKVKIGIASGAGGLAVGAAVTKGIMKAQVREIEKEHEAELAAARQIPNFLRKYWWVAAVIAAVVILIRKI